MSTTPAPASPPPAPSNEITVGVDDLLLLVGRKEAENAVMRVMLERQRRQIVELEAVLAAVAPN